MKIPPIELSAEQKPLEHLIDYVNEFPPLEWSYQGAVIVTRDDLTSDLRGSFSWSGSHGTGSLKSAGREDEALLKLFPYGVILKDEDFLIIRPANGDWEIRRAYVRSTSRNLDPQDKTISYNFRVDFEQLRVGDPDRAATCHAMLIAGVDFGVYPTTFPTDRERQGLSRDGMVTRVFGRPAIIRQLPNPRSREPFLIVAYEGDRLDREESKSLRHLLSFLTGRMGAIVGQFAIDGDREKGRVLDDYDPNESLAKPPVQWFAPNMQPLRQLPTQLSLMLDTMHGLRLDENIAVEVAITHLLSRPRLFDEEVRDIALALDSLIDADAFARNGATLIDPEAYKAALPEFRDAAAQVIASRNLPTSLLDRIEERLRAANDISHGERRRAFFERVGFEPGRREKAALDLRHPMSHRGYLWLDGDGEQKLDGISEQTRIARTFVNAVILSLLGYNGLVFDHLIGANMPRLGKHLSR